MEKSTATTIDIVAAISEAVRRRPARPATQMEQNEQLA
jgi:hypothetical protein